MDCFSPEKTGAMIFFQFCINSEMVVGSHQSFLKHELISFLFDRAAENHKVLAKIVISGNEQDQQTPPTYVVSNTSSCYLSIKTIKFKLVRSVVAYYKALRCVQCIRQTEHRTAPLWVPKTAQKCSPLQ